MISVSLTQKMTIIALESQIILMKMVIEYLTKCAINAHLRLQQLLLIKIPQGFLSHQHKLLIIYILGSSCSLFVVTIEKTRNLNFLNMSVKIHPRNREMVSAHLKVCTILEVVPKFRLLFPSCLPRTDLVFMSVIRFYLLEFFFQRQGTTKNCPLLKFLYTL